MTSAPMAFPSRRNCTPITVMLSAAAAVRVVVPVSEAPAAGTVMLAGTAEEDVYRLTKRVLEDRAVYEGMARAVNPYGDGRAAVRIREALYYSFGLTGERPRPFLPAEAGSRMLLRRVEGGPFLCPDPQ